MSLRWMMIALCALALACGDDSGGNDTSGNGDGNATGDGDGDVAGDGDGDATGDGDGDVAGDGDGDATGDGDGDMTGDGDGDGDGDAEIAYTRIAGGRFAPLDGYDTSTASGAALIAVGVGGTEVSVQLSGLAADTAYPAHVHALPCSLSGGGHYKLDPSVADTMDTNELWPAFTTDADGNAAVTITSDHIARADAMALVVHDPNADNAKMLCADLTPTDFELSSQSGTFAKFAAADDSDGDISGTATLSRSATGTTVAVTIEGLSSDAEYAAHVHALPCAVGDGGGHYKLDPAVEDTVDTNELWPAIMPDADGKATDTVESGHVARADAQSVVVHRKTADAAPKIACADLASASPMVMVTSGDAVPFDLATERDLGDMEASGEMKRKADGTTTVEVSLGGLKADTEYPIHVHDKSCATASGGGHYKLDTGESEALEENEIWLTLTTDSAGAGVREVSVDHVARAEAQALVIHDEDGMRLACIDLL